jgi:MFS family permease
MQYSTAVYVEKGSFDIRYKLFTIDLMHITHPSWPLNHKWTKKSEFFTSISLQSFGFNFLQIFLPIYILKLGYSFTETCLFFILLNSVRIFGNIFFYSLTRFGIKLLLALSYVLGIVGIGFLVIQANTTIGIALGMIMMGLANEIYWNARHLISCGVFDTKNLGKNVGLSIILVYITGALSPLLGGYIGEKFGINYVLITSAIFIVLAIYPLFKSPDIRYAKPKKTNYKFTTKHALAYFASTFEARTLLIWPIFLYLLFGSVESVGFIMAAGMAVTILVTKLSGALSDKGSREPLINVGNFLAGTIGFCRIFTRTLSVAYGINMLMSLAQAIKSPAFLSQFYIHAKKFGATRYIRNMQILAIVSSIIFWYLAYTFSLFFDQSTTISIILIISALLTPLQSLIMSPLSTRIRHR